ncbi:MAG: hypothetical protein ABIP64_01065, partial [Burkholderiales bacterium]
CNSTQSSLSLATSMPSHATVYRGHRYSFALIYVTVVLAPSTLSMQALVNHRAEDAVRCLSKTKKGDALQYLQHEFNTQGRKQNPHAPLL